MTATVVPGLEESYAVAVTRLVLVGRAGLRLHEEVFLAGTRLARRQAVGEQRAEDLLESALDRTDLAGVPPRDRRADCRRLERRQARTDCEPGSSRPSTTAPHDAARTSKRT